MAEPPDYAPPEEWRSLDLILAQVERELTLQLEVSDSYDRKLELLLGFIGVILAAAFGFGPRQVTWPQPAAYLIAPSVGILVLTAFISVWAYFPRKLSRPPEPEFFRTQYLLEDERLTKRDLADAMVVAYNKNQKIIGRKNLLLKCSLSMFSIGIVLFGAGLLVNLSS